MLKILSLSNSVYLCLIPDVGREHSLTTAVVEVEVEVVAIVMVCCWDDQSN